MKMNVLPNAIYRFNVIPIKLPMTFFTELAQIILKFIWNVKDTIAKAILRKKNKSGGITLPDFRQYHIAIVNKISCFQHWNRLMDQCNRLGSLEVNLHTCGQLLFNKGGMNTWWRKDSFFTSVVKSIGKQHVNQWN